MANFFEDNDDIKFHFDHMKLGELAHVMEEGFKFADEYEHAPRGPDEAVDNYRRVLSMLGQLSAEFIEPRAEEIDEIGVRLNEDGSVSYAPGTAECLKKLSQAEVMGFTLPHRFGGLNFPNLVYTMAIDIVSRADASLMNIFGLQGIAETINAYADEQIKAQYLPGFSSGRFTGAMALTEPDAGSDLQAVKLRAWQDDDGQWRLNGVKRFITNGCGEVLLVLARSEPEVTDGRGLSMLLVERNDRLHVRRLENKLGIHGSPTCELVFDDTPATLIGERQRGLITYVMSLMNGARVGIAAQSLGIGEAALGVAREYASTRRQFGMAIEQFPAVRDLLIEMRLDLEAARVLTYQTSRCVDVLYGASRTMAFDRPTDKVELKVLRERERRYKRLAGMLTPMSKYYASEMCVRVASDAIQVLGGSGYMKDYPCERYLRDARITTIYEGTSQLQVVAAVRGVMQGTLERMVEEVALTELPQELAPLLEALQRGTAAVAEAVEFVKQQPGVEYMDLYGRKLVDAAIDVICGYLFLRDAQYSERKAACARRWIGTRMPRVNMFLDLIKSGDRSTITEFDTLVGPVPTAD